MGRSLKYKTLEERAEARRQTKRAYYSRNAERERDKSLTRWRAKKAKSARSKGKEAQTARVLVATERVLGASLTPHSRTPWGQLREALYADLASWRGARSATDQDEYDTLTRELISCTDAGQKTAQRLLARVEKKQQLLNTLCTVARAADSMHLDLHPATYTNHFAQIYRDALAIDCALESIVLLYRESSEKLKSSYECRTMYWQCPL